MTRYDDWKLRAPDDERRSIERPERCAHDSLWEECPECRELSDAELEADRLEHLADWLRD